MWQTLFNPSCETQVTALAVGGLVLLSGLFLENLRFRRSERQLKQLRKQTEESRATRVGRGGQI